MVVFILLAALLPAAFLFLYIWKKDPQKEPASWLFKAFLGGVVICIPIAILELVMEAVLFGGEESLNLIGTTIWAFLGVALPEEVGKLLVLWLLLRKNPFFDEHFDGIAYAVCLGLGFAAIENVFYVFGEEEWVAVALSRALLAVPGHYAFAILMGYYYSLHHFVDHSQKTAACVLLIPVLAHGIYDAIAMNGAINPYFGFVAFFAIIYFCVKMHKTAYKKIVVLIEKDRNKVQPIHV